jgi:hypothetical protein
MPDMHKKALFTAQKTTISHTADAHGGFFLPVPPQQLFPSGGFNLHNLKGPGFPVALFFCPLSGTIASIAHWERKAELSPRHHMMNRA